jgi:hypothetical protein
MLTGTVLSCLFISFHETKFHGLAYNSINHLGYKKIVDPDLKRQFFLLQKCISRYFSTNDHGNENFERMGYKRN